MFINPLKKNMRNFFYDIKNYFFYKINEKKYLRAFFFENVGIFNHLTPHLNNRKKRGEVAIILFNEISDPSKFTEKNNIYIFKTNLIREFFFLTLNVRYFYCSTPDLNRSVFKRTKFFQTKYIYLQHSPVSLTSVYNDNAFNSFDAIQAIGNYQYDEIKEINRIYNINIRPFKAKYAFLSKENIFFSYNLKKSYDVLIAPTWNTNFYSLNLHLLLIKEFREKDITYKLRPHQMSIKKNIINIKENKNLYFDLEDKVNFSAFKYLITDWSGIFIEYFLIKKQKPFLVNTLQKVGKGKKNNKIIEKAVENKWRSIISEVVNVDQIKKIPDMILKIKKKTTLHSFDTLVNEFKKNFY